TPEMRWLTSAGGSLFLRCDQSQKAVRCLEMNSEPYTLRTVASVSETDTGAMVLFKGGCAGVLHVTHPEYRWSLDRLESSRESGSPIGVRFKEDSRIADVAGADRNVVIGLRENEHDPTVVDVWFAGESGLYRLHKRSGLSLRSYH